MTALGKCTKNFAVFCQRSNVIRNFAARTFSSQGGSDEKPPESAPGWLTRLLMSRPSEKIETGKESHSRMLADKETVYELQINAVNPACMMEYLDRYETFVNMVHEKKTGAELAGSWTVEIGDQDEAIHLWKYPGGYPVLNQAREIYRTDKEFLEFRVKRNEMLRHRKNQILLAFSFWGDIQPREGKWIYELRSYTLRPGTMIEWGNNWAKGIQNRQDNDEAVAGLFSHIGDLYNVHHIWGPKVCQLGKPMMKQLGDFSPQWGTLLPFIIFGFLHVVLTRRAKGLKSRLDNDEPVAGFFSQIGDLPMVHHIWAYESLQSRKEVREAAWRRPGWDECVAYTVPLIRHMTSRILIPTPFSPMQ